MKKKTTHELGRISAEAFEKAPKLPLRVVLDNVRSQHNIGAVFRTADSFLLDEIELCGICCCPPNQELHKTALGAEETVAWRYWKDTLDAVHALHEEGYTVYAVEQAFDSVTLREAVIKVQTPPDLPSREEKGRRIAVVFGHEVFGVQQEVIDACDGCIEIPQYGTKHSLNVSVTAGIVLYELSEALRA